MPSEAKRVMTDILRERARELVSRNLAEWNDEGLASFAEEMLRERDDEWLAFMQSKMWDGAVAISTRDFLKR